MEYRRKSGFTLTEILISVAILSLVSYLIVLSLSSFARGNALDLNTRNISSGLERARDQAVYSREYSDYGVHLESGSYTIFKGDSYSASDPSNRIFTLESGISISEISLEGGGSDVVFKRLTGGTNESGSLTVLKEASSETSVVVIDKSGLIRIQ